MAKKIKVKVKLPKNLIGFMDELIDRGYYASRSEIFRVALIDLIIEKFDIDIDDIEPDILEDLEEEEEEEDEEEEEEKKEKKKKKKKKEKEEEEEEEEEETVIVAEPPALLEAVPEDTTEMEKTESEVMED